MGGAISRTAQSTRERQDQQQDHMTPDMKNLKIGTITLFTSGKISTKKCVKTYKKRKKVLILRKEAKNYSIILPISIFSIVIKTHLNHYDSMVF